MSNQMYIRLKPYNPRRGYTLKRFCVSGKVFQSGNWYKVSEATAQAVSELHQKAHDEDSPYAFDVATEQQARAIEDAEKARQEAERRKVDRAEVVSAQELRDDTLRGGAMTTRALPKRPSKKDKALEAKASKPKQAESRDLGVSMANSKDELTDVAESLGINVQGLSKRAMLTKIEAALSQE